MEKPSIKKLLQKNDTEAPLLLDVLLTNEVSESALCRLTSVSQRKKLPLTDVIKLQMKEKQSAFENIFLSYCNQ